LSITTENPEDRTNHDPAPWTSRILTVDGRAVHVDIRGDGPAIILLHGASGNLRDMTFDLARRLERSYRVISFDRPGLGRSDPLHDRGESPREQARHLARAAEQLGVGKAVIVGHSYGGAVALAWALEAPDQAAAVVSLAGVAMPWPGGLGFWYDFASNRLVGRFVLPVLARLVPDRYVHNAIRNVFLPDAPPEDYADHIGIDLALDPRIQHTNAAQVARLRPHVVEMSAEYDGLDLPVELLHGTLDDTVPARIHSTPLSKIAPNANLTLLPDTGHMPHHAEPDITVDVIERAARRAGLT
jgi:pimeloyl-ACP methyl ester carboxylesterase